MIAWLKSIGRLLLMGSCCLLVIPALAQRTNEDEALINRIIERLIENSEADADYLDLQDQLTRYLRHPLNLNRANRNTLLSLGILNEQQVNNLLRHRELYGKFLSVYELQAVQGFDLELIRTLLPFTSINTLEDEDQTSLRKMFKNGRHELILLQQQELQERRGFRVATEEQTASNSFEGSRLRSLVRYRYSYSNRMSIGYTGEKDAGEAFFNKGQSSFDFNSAHFYLRNTGIFRHIAIGDYQVQFGQGLTIGTGLGFGKSALVTNVMRNTESIRPYRSVNENEFMRGGATTLRWKSLQLTGFYSRKRVDGNIDDTDTLSAGTNFTSIVSSGLHRTQNELIDKDAVLQTIFGGHVQWDYKGLRIGATYTSMDFDRTFARNTQPYNQFEAGLNNLSNTGIDYKWHISNATFFGEGARSSNGGLALISGVLVALDPKVDAVILYRNYDRAYSVLYSNAFGENSRNTNEEGIYTGITIKPIKKWSISAYFDSFRSRWLRFLTDAPSIGKDYLAEIAYKPSKTINMYWRFRQEVKERNTFDNTTAVDFITNHTRRIFRYQLTYKATAALTSKTRVEWAFYDTDNRSPENGLLIFQDLIYKPLGSRISVYGRLAMFNTDGFNSRIYAYENDVLYQYSVPAFQQQGIRNYLMVRYSPKRWVQFWLRYASTTFANLDTVGSGVNEIEGNRRSDIKFQVRLLF